MKRKILFLFLILSFVFLFSISAFAFAPVGLVTGPVVTSTTGSNDSGNNVSNSFSPIPVRYTSGDWFTDSRSYLSGHSYYGFISDNGDINYVNRINPRENRFDYLITVIDCAYTDKDDVLNGVSYQSITNYEIASEPGSVYTTRSLGGWIYIVFGDKDDNIRECRITIPNTGFDNSFNLSFYIDEIRSLVPLFDHMEYIHQIQVKQSILQSVNVPSSVPVTNFESHIIIDSDYLSSFTTSVDDYVAWKLNNTYDQGAQYGEQIGYENGYNDGKIDGSKIENNGAFNWMIRSVGAFIGAPIFYAGDIPVSLGGIIGLIMSFSLLIWLLKLLAGG